METNSPIIADSSAPVSLSIRSDRNHAAAVELVQQIATASRTVVIPCEVFSETVNILGKKFGHALAIEAVEIMLDGGVFIVEDSGDKVRRDALNWFGTLPESVSYTDCIVMTVANANNTKQVFGFDDAISKNGCQLPQTKQAA